MKIEYQRYDTRTECWVDFAEFIKFTQPTYVISPEKFGAWVVKHTPKGKRQSWELMRSIYH